MKKNSIYYLTAFLFCFIFSTKNIAQNVGINSTGAAPDSSAMLDITSPDKGLLIPRMDSISRMNIVTPAEGLMVFDSTYNSFYFYDGTAWGAIGSGGGSDNLGNHIATQNVQLKDNWLNNDGDADEGIYVDTLGNVGIGEKTSSTFNVRIKEDTITQVMVNNTYFITSLGGSPSVYQTFTANSKDSITNVSVTFKEVNGPTYTGENKVMSIYEGVGTGGSLLFTSAPVFVPSSGVETAFDFPVNGVEVNNGQVYTIYFVDGEGIGYNYNGYGGGSFSMNGAWDMVFSINSFHIVQNPGLSVSDTGIVLNNYALPLADGSSGQVLATDGSGTMSWISANSQDLSLINDTLTIGNGQTPIDLTPYKESDNLGNHQANQNLQMNNHWLNNDGGNNEGIFVDSLGRVGIGGIPQSKLHVNMGYTGSSGVHISSPTVNASTFTSTAWQSFTPTNNGFLTGFTIGTNTSQSPITYTLYNGEGTSGNIIATSNSNNNYASFSNIPLEANEIYTIGFVRAFSFSFPYDNSDPYSGGQSNLGIGSDYQFWIHMILDIPGFKVDDSGVTINNYSLPNFDGATDQVLSTNGSGILSWTNKTSNTDNQQLTISNDSLYLTNNATPISLSPYLQQLTISNDSLYLSNDTTVINLSPYLDNTDNQQLTISNDSLFLTNDASAINLNPYLDNTDNQQLSLSGNNLSLTNGGTPISLSPFLDADDLGNHTATQNLIIGGNAIQNNTSSANGLSMGAENQLLVESDFQRTGHFTTTGVNVFGDPFGNYLEVNNKTGTRSIFGADGNGLYSLDTLNTVLGNWTPGGGITFHVSAGTKVMTLDASGNLGLGRIAATNRLEVEGNASKSAAGDWLANSDARLKKNITSLSSEIILEKMLSLQGVTYEWNDNKTNTKRPEGIQYGFTAQNIQEVFPTLVTEDNNGFLQTPYGTYDAMTVEAIRALNDKIEKLETDNAQLRSQLSEVSNLKSELETIKKMLKVSSSESSESFGETKK